MKSGVIQHTFIALLIVAASPPALARPTLASSTPPPPVERVDRPNVSAPQEHAVPGRVVVGLRSPGVEEEVRRAIGQQGLSFKGPQRRGAIRIVEVERGREAEIARRLAQLPGVEYAELDYVVRASAPRTPVDELYASKQWDMAKINMPDAWGVTVGERSVAVAMLDTGITLMHPDLTTQWTYAPGRLPVEHVFLSAPLSEGCTVPPAPVDDYGHGTHVAGTIGAASTLSGAAPVGVAGMAPGARILPLKVLDCRGNGYLSDAASAIDFAVEMGVPIINMSFGGTAATGCPTYLQGAVNRAVAAGVFLAAAAGNDGDASVQFPAGCAGIVGVGATTTEDALATFSNRNTSVALSAPGVEITSTWTTGGYAVGDGTSMATPHVAGCAALAKSAFPAATGVAIRAVLQSTAVDLGAAGYDTAYGWGRLDCGAALRFIASVQPTPTPTVPAGSGGVGGKGLTITSEAQRVALSWLPGAGQTGYTVARLAGNQLTMVPAGGLAATATGYIDTAVPPGLSCYAVFVLGTTPQGQSDLECAVVGFGTATGSPRAFTLRLNQSSTTTLSWSPPDSGAPDAYLLVTLGGAALTLPSTTTTAAIPVAGFTCFAVGALRNGALIGYSDFLCGLPGFSNLGGGAAQ